MHVDALSPCSDLSPPQVTVRENRGQQLRRHGIFSLRHKRLARGHAGQSQFGFGETRCRNAGSHLGRVGGEHHERSCDRGDHERAREAVVAGRGRAPHYASLRAGDIVGEHTVQFATLGERIELVHRATNRDIFARGALEAALRLAAQGCTVIALAQFSLGGLLARPQLTLFSGLTPVLQNTGWSTSPDAAAPLQLSCNEPQASAGSGRWQPSSSHLTITKRWYVFFCMAVMIH